MRKVFQWTNRTYGFRVIVEENMGRYYTRTEPVDVNDKEFIYHEPKTWPTLRAALMAACDCVGE